MEFAIALDNSHRLMQTAQLRGIDIYKGEAHAEIYEDIGIWGEGGGAWLQEGWSVVNSLQLPLQRNRK